MSCPLCTFRSLSSVSGPVLPHPSNFPLSSHSREGYYPEKEIPEVSRTRTGEYAENRDQPQHAAAAAGRDTPRTAESHTPRRPSHSQRARRTQVMTRTLELSPEEERLQAQYKHIESVPFTDSCCDDPPPPQTETHASLTPTDAWHFVSLCSYCCCLFLCSQAVPDDSHLPGAALQEGARAARRARHQEEQADQQDTIVRRHASSGEGRTDDAGPLSLMLCCHVPLSVPPPPPAVFRPATNRAHRLPLMTPPRHSTPPVRSRASIRSAHSTLPPPPLRVRMRTRTTMQTVSSRTSCAPSCPPSRRAHTTQPCRGSNSSDKRKRRMLSMMVVPSPDTLITRLPLVGPARVRCSPPIRTRVPSCRATPRRRARSSPARHTARFSARVAMSMPRVRVRACVTRPVRLGLHDPSFRLRVLDEPPKRRVSTTTSTHPTPP